MLQPNLTTRILCISAYVLLIAACASGSAPSKEFDKLPLPSATVSDQESPLKVEILQVGIVNVTSTDDPVMAPMTTTGFTTSLSIDGFETNSNRIPARLGVSWGVDYRVTGSKQRMTTLTMRTVHPPITNPDLNRTSTESLWFDDVPIGFRDARYYTLEFDWEVVPGDWAFEFYDGDTLIGRQEFVLYEPDDE